MPVDFSLLTSPSSWNLLGEDNSTSGLAALLPHSPEPLHLEQQPARSTSRLLLGDRPPHLAIDVLDHVLVGPGLLMVRVQLQRLPISLQGAAVLDPRRQRAVRHHGVPILVVCL